jgi:hypothetical protein
VHYQGLVLEIEPAPLQSSSPEKWLLGLKGQMRITDAAGAIIVEKDISPEGVTGQDGHGHIYLATFPSIPKGRYQFQFNVDSPATAMPAGQQILTIQYLLCGMEYMPAALCLLGAYGSFAIAGLLGLITGILWFVRRRKSRSTVDEQVSQSP